MQRERAKWPDSEGQLVGPGDWIEVWCTWTGQPKFDGRAVQIVDVLSGSGQCVFRLRDPELEVSCLQYMPVLSRGFRLAAKGVSESGVIATPGRRSAEDPEGEPKKAGGDNAL